MVSSILEKKSLNLPMALEKGDRLSYDGELCTVKFIGEIPAWPNEVALGVEWDNPQKGKHNGSFKGIQYFTTHDDSNSGSFLKKSKKHDVIQTFYEALVNTYGTSFEKLEIKIGSKLVESYGFEKLQRLQSDFTYLKNISLSRKQIRNLGPEEGKLIRDQLVNLRELDISFNLISSWSRLVDIVTCLELERLKGVGNRFTQDFDTSGKSSLKILDLTFTRVSDSVLDVIPNNFPQLQQLLLSDNCLDHYNEKLNDLDQLEELDLSMNNIPQIPEGLKYSKIHKLIISNNKIRIYSTDTTFPQITTLDIRRNDITEWVELNKLTKMFPNLTSLRINGNPLFSEISIDEMEMSVIARFENLTAVNGTTISEEERTNAELYFISKSGKSNDFDQERVEKLAKKHVVNINHTSHVSGDNIGSRLVTLKLKHQDQVIEMQILKSIEILKLKGMISRLFKISYIDMNTSYEISNVKESINGDLSLVSSYEFEDGQEICIQKIT